MLTVRAKFYVGEKTMRSNGKHDSQPTQFIKLFPVTSGNEENKKFYRYTPFGSIELGILNNEAGKQFELGAEYYVDFTKADAE